jgi:hypothetical protein
MRYIKKGGGVQALKVRVCRITWLKVDNVLREWISVIDLNCYMTMPKH